MEKVIKYIEFVAPCAGELAGVGTDYEGFLRDDKKGAESALAQLNLWRNEKPREIVATNFGIVDITRDPPNFKVSVLYSE